MHYHQLPRVIAFILITLLSVSLPVRLQTKPSKPSTDFSEIRKLIQARLVARAASLGPARPVKTMPAMMAANASETSR